MLGGLAVGFFQAEDGIRDVERSRGLGDVYKRQDNALVINTATPITQRRHCVFLMLAAVYSKRTRPSFSISM